MRHIRHWIIVVVIALPLSQALPDESFWFEQWERITIPTEFVSLVE